MPKPPAVTAARATTTMPMISGIEGPGKAEADTLDAGSTGPMPVVDGGMVSLEEGAAAAVVDGDSVTVVDAGALVVVDGAAVEVVAAAAVVVG